MGLPSGQITFVFTDVVGSSALAESEPERYLKLLETHDHLIEEIVAANGGKVIKQKGEGDSTFSVFSSASNALISSAKIRTTLIEVGLTLRIGVHSGEATLIEQDYRGDAINRCARIRGLAEPNQILVSESTKSQVDSIFRFRSSGIHRMKGMINEIELFELVDEKQPLIKSATSIAPTFQGIRPPNRFVGRQKLFHEIEERLREYRVVSLHGGGGIGKSRLAVEYASNVEAIQPGSVIYLNLSEINSGEFLQLLKSNLKLSSSQEIFEEIRSQNLLFVLDNVENLIEVVAAWAEEFSHLTQRPQLLITTQITLDISAESVIRVGELEEDAYELLRVRAREFGVGNELFVQQKPLVERLLRLLQGNPLAIEIVAGKLKSMPLKLIIDKLEDILHRDSRTSGLSRWGSFKELANHSLRMLSDSDIRVATSLSFLGELFTFDAACLVCGLFDLDAYEATEIVDRLYRHAILESQWDQMSIRYRLLGAFKRELQSSALANELKERVETAVIAHACELTESILKSDRIIEMTRPILRDLMNALLIAVSRGDRESSLTLHRICRKVWLVDGSGYLGLVHTRRVQSLGDWNLEQRSELLNSEAIFLGYSGQSREAIEKYQLASNGYQELGNTARVVIVGHNIAIEYHRLGDREMSIRSFESCAQAAKEIGDIDTWISAQMHLAMEHYVNQDLESALIAEAELKASPAFQNYENQYVLENSKAMYYVRTKQTVIARDILRNIATTDRFMEGDDQLFRMLLMLTGVFKIEAKEMKANQSWNLCNRWRMMLNIHLDDEDHKFIDELALNLVFEKPSSFKLVETRVEIKDFIFNELQLSQEIHI